MAVTVRYFASLRETLGASEAVELPGPGCSLAQLRDTLIARGGPHADALGRQRPLRCAIDQVLVDEDAVISDAAEVAFFPPVTGG